MKLLFVIDSLGSGGAQRQMVILARGLKERGHHIEFFTYYQQDHYAPLLDEVGIPVKLFQKSSRFSFGPLFALRKTVNQNHYDLVLSFLDTPNFYSELALIGIKKTKLVVSERFMYPPGKLSPKLYLLQQFHRLSNAITVNSQHQRLRMVELFPWMTGVVRTIYNGVDLDKFYPANVPTNNDSCAAFEMISIGTVVAKKNMLGLAKALVLCRQRYGLKAHVRWVGKEDHSADGRQAYEEVLEYIEAHHLNDQWEWLGERTDVPDLLRKHDALMHPSFYEGLPNVVCEALACGLPVLASNVCDHPLLVKDGIRGFLFDPHSPESISEAIFKMSSMKAADSTKLRVAARTFAAKNLSATSFTDKYESLFKMVLNEQH